MSNPFFEHPFIKSPYIKSPYIKPASHWELDEIGQPIQKIKNYRRMTTFLTTISKPRKQCSAVEQGALVFDEGKGLSIAVQLYDPPAVINECRCHVEEWRELPNHSDWYVTPETASLLQHCKRKSMHMHG